MRHWSRGGRAVRIESPPAGTLSWTSWRLSVCERLGTGYHFLSTEGIWYCLTDVWFIFCTRSFCCYLHQTSCCESLLWAGHTFRCVLRLFKRNWNTHTSFKERWCVGRGLVSECWILICSNVTYHIGRSLHINRLPPQKCCPRETRYTLNWTTN